MIDGNINHILFKDESMIRYYQAISRTWFPKGQQRIIAAYGKHEGVKLLGIINYETGSVYCEEHSKYYAEVFLGFPENVLQQYPEGKIVMILDNSRVHHAKLLKGFWKRTVPGFHSFFSSIQSQNEYNRGAMGLDER
ncbi:transposase [Clostridium luticellarii]|uniref:Tc1-like transposase DDE domain-containing protein n=1 Tax=Clostridium luticellarii TaxID=1691940 RepID=A0A2T0B6W8_9CLOT|nr:transposase [Clostridium luticellarii]PRR79630.1 hypothetical protein CLLU_34740 [Clostridium luticellarii]